VLQEILFNKLLIVPVCAWCVAQVLKVLVDSVQKKRLDLSQLVNMGGMPSAHSALVCALATSAAIIYGLNSGIFAITVIFAGIVMYDAIGVRQEVGTQSTIINRMLDELFKGSPTLFEQRLRELIGHTHLEVATGAALGILFAWLLT
jgi:hypothetical protein